ncbi:MAG TPA: LysR family transcriptional regulator [Paucimonas sp.]|nr:LysR family transcriptional regulator [Paucimonas sp.]
MDKTAAAACNFADQLDWNDVRYALTVARCGSLVSAARALGVDQTTVSRRLRVLESGIGTPLFERLKGQMAPTPAGIALMERGARIEREIAALRYLAADHQAQVQGVTRITAVDAIVSHYLARHLATLRARHPGLAVELIGSSKTLDLSRREADIAIRLARPESGDLVVRRLATLAYGVYGTGAVPAADDWSARNWVAYEHSLAQVPEMQWLSTRVGDDRIVFRCNNMDALTTAVADGLGLGVLPRLVGERHASLCCLSGEQPVLEREMWLAVPRELRHVPRIRAVSDWLVERFRADADLFG